MQAKHLLLSSLVVHNKIAVSRLVVYGCTRLRNEYSITNNTFINLSYFFNLFI